MRAWRLTRRSYQALDGEGVRLYGGRWNSEGVPVVYASSTLSLAALEYLVHLDIEDVPDDLVALEIEVPDDAAEVEVSVSELPPEWTLLEEYPVCVALGDRWASRAEVLVLRVPSVVIPTEQNVLLNPLHPDMARVRVAAVRDFAFDPRLL